MSATNSNSSDGDLDAIHRAQRAHEPSMEEILASIRNIIADDPAKEAGPKRQPAPAPTPQIGYLKDAPRALRRRPRTVPASGRRARRQSFGAARKRSRPNPPRAPMRLQPSSEPLLSPEANEAVALSFGALSANLEVRSAELADSMVRDMLRPMVKTVAGRQSPDPRRAAGAG